MNIFYKDKDFWLGWSENQGILFLHIDVYNWSFSVYKKILFTFSDLLNQFKGKILFSVCGTKKEKKFNELFGLQEVTVLEDGTYLMKVEA